MAVLGSWKSGALPTVTGNVTLASGVGVPTAPALLANNSAGAAAAQFLVSNPSSMTARFYVRTPPAWVSAAFTICAFRVSASSSAVVVNLGGTGAPGQVRLVKTGGTTVSQSSSGVLSTNTDYRFEVRWYKATNIAALSVFAMGSDTPLWEGNGVDAAWGVDLMRVDIGLPQASPAVPELHVDSIEITDSGALIGRDADDLLTVVPTTVQYWNGTSLVTATVQYWDGTSLVPVSKVQYWDGSTLSS